MQTRRQYPFHEIEPKWQDIWEDRQVFKAANPGESGSEKPKYYALDMFPYPSGDGLHVGHPEGYTATDIISRYKRMRGFNVLHPMGWDAFGLPAEQYAIQTGTHPRETTQKNIANFKRQIRSLGFSYDWDREIDTTDPEYFRWTQWIFLQLYKKDLAYVADAPVWYCPALGTVLANEEINQTDEGPRSDRGNHPVERRPLRQWMLKITAYAERLLADLDGLDWPESLKEMQRNWIGKSEGAEVQFQVSGSEAKITVFTTRPDTLFGATYMVLSPEHPLVPSLTTVDQKEAVDAYKKQVSVKSDLERTDLAKTKSGVFTGSYAINPVNDSPIAIWIADYVLMGYGTGAIMAVPAHDQRDFEFAEKFGLDVIQVVKPTSGEAKEGCFAGEGVALNSGFLNDLSTAEAKAKITAWLQDKGLGKKTIQFKLRDWLFSRQRYWGEPFPIVWKGEQHRAIREEDLPLTLPEMEDFKPTEDGKPPLSKAESWLNVTGGLRRETNTMPQWAGSCWYYLRYCDPKNSKRLIDPEVEKYWMGSKGVDLYIGGAEHAVLHLLYARFWHKVLFDIGVVSTSEPFYKLVNQGLILGEMEYFLFRRPAGGTEPARDISSEKVRNIEERPGSGLIGVEIETGIPIPGGKIKPDSGYEIEKRGDFFFVKGEDIRVEARSSKMSKSRHNVVNPDDVIAEFGADSLRLFEMFMGPLEQVKPWSTKGVEGVYRFLGRVWRLVMVENQEGEWVPNPAVQDAPASAGLQKVAHHAIKKVTEDLDGLRFNTCISELMVLTNELTKAELKPLATLKTLLTLLSPFAPHVAEELWEILKFEGLACQEPWPQFDPALLVEAEVEIVVQVNGKIKDRMTVPTEFTPPDYEAKVRAHPSLPAWIGDKEIKKIISVPKKLVNIVVG